MYLSAIIKNPIFSKILEKIVSTQLTTFLESNNYLAINQHGFRHKLSTETAFHVITDKIYNNMDNKRISLQSTYMPLFFLSILFLFCFPPSPHSALPVPFSPPICSFLSSSLPSYSSLYSIQSSPSSPVYCIQSLPRSLQQ